MNGATRQEGLFRPSTPTEPIPQAAWREISPVGSVDGEPLFADDLMASIVPETPSSMPPQPSQQLQAPLLGTPQKQDWQMRSDSLSSTVTHSVAAQPALLMPKQHSFYTQRVGNGGVDYSGTAQKTHAEGDLGTLSDLEVPSTCAMVQQNKLVHEMLALEPLGKSGEEAWGNFSLKQGLLLRDPHDDDDRDNSGDTRCESPNTLINLLQQLVGRADSGSIRYATSVVRGALEQKHPPLPAPQQPVREGDQQPSATSSDFSAASGMAKQVVDEVRRKVEMGDEYCASHTQGVIC